MKSGEVFSKTMKFCWLKLGLGILNVVVSLVLLLICIGIGMLFGSDGVTAIMLIIWCGLSGAVSWFVKYYVGYLLKAGHVAAIAQSFKDGAVPSDPVGFGVKAVKSRFATANVYFVLDRLVSGAVSQLQRGFSRVMDLFGAIPGADAIKSFGNFFINISLGYIDECCLGYTFYNTEQNAYKSAADGVVIYAQNWKQMLKSALKTALTVIFSMLAITIGLFVVLALIFKVFDWNMLIAFVIAALLAYAVKYAFVDSFILVKTMSAYFEVAPTTQITFDLYGKLCGLSSKFKQLFNKSGATAPAYAAAGAAGYQNVQPQFQQTYQQPYQQQNAAPSGNSFCPSCGAQIPQGKTFCGSCGTKVN